MRFLSLLGILFFSQFVFCQNGTIKGSVLDDSNGSTLPGVNVSIKELKFGTNTDSDGKFTLRNIKAGTYEVEFSFMGYQPKIVSEVIVVANETTILDVTLKEVKNLLEEVVIKKTKAKAESVNSLLTIQKNNVSVSDGISAETIKKTPDKTTSDVLKRISGASIQDNKFVIIRGLNDRYNTALLNGAPLPSSEPDRKAFSFDIFPSNMLDNLVINKTASPDMPGEFAGGVVQINTKSVPDKNFQSITIGTGYNTITTFKEQKDYKGSSTDWLGFDNGKRDFPSSIPSPEAFASLSFEEKALVAKSFESDWNINDATFKPNTSFQYSIGRQIKFKEKSLGLLLSLSNNKTNNFNETQRNDYEQQGEEFVLQERFNDNNYTEQVLTAALGNFSFKFNDKNLITFKNILSINSTDLVVERTGKKNVEETRVINSDVRWFTSNTIYSGQLNGENTFSKAKIKLNWGGFFSDIKRSIPNLRRNIYTIEDPNSPDPALTLPYAVIANNNGGADYGGGIFYSENTESLKGIKLDLSKKFNFGKEFINEVKAGVFTQNRERDFFARQLQYNTLTNGGSFQESLLNLPNATIFSQQNMGVISPGVNGFTLFEITKPTDKYDANSDLNAAYIMFDNRYKKFRVVWGVRLEKFSLNLKAKLSDTEDLDLVREEEDFLPSLNVIFSINKKQNLRFSFSRTLNRPEYRELAPFGFYDFTTQFFTQGNPELKTAKIDNLDLRYEFYPGKGQLFSLSYFKKSFENPIEIIQEVNNRTISYKNTAGAKNSGIELEFRTLVSSLFSTGDSGILNDLTLFSNVAIIKSLIDTSNINSANIETSRPLQGQSPYVFNAGLQYLKTEKGISISTNINRAGNRIFITEAEGKPAIWEKGRTFIDMQIAKSFNKNKMELKLNIQNLLAQDLIFYQNNYKNTETFGTLETLANDIFTGDYHYEDGYSERDDDVIWRTKFGRSFSLSFTYNF